jgi:DNA-directed RNA polymerase subunit RPC12/RpoP
MSQIQRTKENRCIYCGSKMKACDECGKEFHATRVDHIYCSTRCRKRRERNAPRR